MGNPVLRKIFLTSFLYFICRAFPQSNELYFHTNPGNVFEGHDVIISQLMFIDEPIVSGLLFYRIKGELSFQEIPMNYEGGSWVGVIQGNRVTEPGIEYVTIINRFDGGQVSLPNMSDPFSNPLQINVTREIQKNENDLLVSGQSGKKRKLSGQYVDADILILSPEDGSLNRQDEIVISASLFNAPLVDQSDYKVLLDGQDLTSHSIISGDVLSLVPDGKLNVGFHTIQLLFKTTFGVDITPVEWSFNVNKPMTNISESFRYKGSLNAKSSSSTASSITINENEYSGKIDGELSWIKARYTMRRTNRESNFLQPLNRSTLSFQITDYLKMDFGDIYPSISPFILDGKRLKGRHIHLDMPWLDFHLVNGKFTRAIQYQNKVNGAYELLTNDTVFDSTARYTFKLSRKGYTFPQDVIAGRLALSLFKVFKGGIHFLKAKDDIDGVNKTAPGSSLFKMDTTLYSNYKLDEYSYKQFVDSLARHGDTLIIPTKNWNNGTPKENLAFGFDLETALDNRKLLFQFAWNMSLTNTNIWAGIANSDSLDLMMDTLSDGLIMEKYDILTLGENIEKYENIFTIHPRYMTPILPIDPNEFNENPFRAIINMPASAFYFRMKGNYSFNNLLVEYRQIGSEYKSFGNPYLTNNIREFIINDRLSALGRRLMMVVGYKYKDNNLSETVANPVKTNTISFNTTLVPGPGAPSIVLNIQSIGRDNSIDSLDLDSYGNFLSDRREDSRGLNVMASVNIPGNFGKLTTTTSINANFISYSDNLASERRNDFLFQKTETQSFSITISSRFQIPLRTTMSFNSTKLLRPYMLVIDSLGIEPDIPAIEETNWTSMNSTAQYSLFQNKLRVRGGLDFMTNGETGDSSIKLYGGKIGGDYDILDKLTLSINSSIRMNDINKYKTDNSDNDNDGTIDEANENWSVNNSGFYMTLGYRF